MRFSHILRALLVEPWLITPAAHYMLQQIVHSHLTGAAHARDLIFEDTAVEKAEMGRDGDIALIPIYGIIGRRVSTIEKSSGVTDVLDINDMLSLSLDDETINGIVLDIDSPGGMFLGVPELGERIRVANSIKPVVAYTSGQMDSAAYWLGAQARAILASPSSSVGAIGVYMAILDESRAYDMDGLRVDVFSSGAMKAMGIPGTSLTPQQKAHLQATVDHVADIFRNAVLQMRPNLNKDVFDGRSELGFDAKKSGLIDYLGTLEDAIKLARTLSQMR